MIRNGSGVKDDVPATLMRGEYVMKQSAVNKYGEKFFHDLNEGRVKFATGGAVTQKSLNQKYGINFSKPFEDNTATQPGLFGIGSDSMDLNMGNIATQDKEWFGPGHMPAETFKSVEKEAEKGFGWMLRNTFALNDKERPSLGRFFVDKNMSNYALEDTNNPMNELREKRRGLFVDYRQYLNE